MSIDLRFGLLVGLLVGLGADLDPVKPKISMISKGSRYFNVETRFLL